MKLELDVLRHALKLDDVLLADGGVGLEAEAFSASSAARTMRLMARRSASMARLRSPGRRARSESTTRRSKSSPPRWLLP
jgi:hypothetical protein